MGSLAGLTKRRGSLGWGFDGRPRPSRGQEVHKHFKERIEEHMEHLVLSCLESRLEGNGSIYGRFLLGPFKVGQGTTIGTALRRTLLSELQSLAITAAEIKGATHQYSSVPGVRESTLDIVLNLKQIVLTGEIINELPAVGYLTVRGPKIARARDLKLPNGVCCVDEDQHIASVSANGVLTIKFVVSAGKNYVSPHSPSAQTLAPSLFQPKMREGSTTPLALRASGQPLHRLVEMVGRNSPHDVRHGQHPLFRGRKLSRLTGGIDDVVVANIARRGVYAAALKSVDSSPGVSALITNAEAARFTTTPWLRDNAGSEATGQQGGDNPPLLASSDIVETSQSRLTEHREAGQANRFLLGRDQASRFRSVKATNLFPGIEEGGGSLATPTLARGYVAPATSHRAHAEQGHRGGGVFAAGIQQVSTNKPGNTEESTKLGDGNRFIEMTLGETQASSTAPSNGQVLAGLAQRGRQWEANSAPLPIDAVFMPVKKVNFALQIDDQWQEPRERVILEIWTNGSIHPRQAISEAATSLVYLFSLFRQADARSAPVPMARLRPRWSGWGSMATRSTKRRTPVRTGQSRGSLQIPRNSSVEGLTDNTRRSSIDVANLDLSVQAYAVLKRAGINTLEDLMNSSLDSLLLNPSISQEIEAMINSLV